MKNIWVIIFAFFIYISSGAQNPELKFREVPDQKKLSSQFTTCIAQDKSGYIWIGTIDGLNRYDGHQMRVYRNSQDGYPNLANNNIRTIFPDSKNRIWVGTIWGLSLYNPEIDDFELLSSSGNPAGLESSFVYQVEEDEEGNIYVAAGKAIYIFDPETKYFSKLIDLPEGDVVSFLLMTDGTIWTGQDTGGGIKRFSHGNYDKSILPDWISKEDSALLASYTIMDIEQEGHNLWVATRGKGLFKLDFYEKEFKTYLDYSDKESIVISLYKDHKDNIWACNYSGLKYYNAETDSLFGYFPDPSKNHSIKGNPINIFQDHQQNYWIIYSERGFDFSPVDRGFTHYKDSENEPFYLHDINIMALEEDKEGNLWAASFNSGITVFNWQDNTSSFFESSKKSDCSLGQGTIFDLHKDSDETMWVATYWNGLQKYISEEECFLSYTKQANNQKSIGGNDIRSIAEDSSGNFWLAVHGFGVDYFDRESETFQHFTPQNSDLSIEWTNQVMVDSRNTLWVATSYGLNKMRIGKNTFDTYVSDGQRVPGGLNSDDVICLHETPDGTVWIGTTNGLHSYDRDKDRFIFQSKDFENQYICSIEHDDDGKLWISTHGGLISYDPRTGMVFNFDVYDGLQSNDFNIKSSYSDDDGMLYFGGPLGINAFQPEKIKYNTTPPKVILTDLKLYNKPVTEFGEDQPLNKHISVADKITLSDEYKFFTIEYTAINYLNPEKNSYAYRLEGFEDRWNMVNEARQATYTNLNPGKYTFRVKAANSDGIWNEEGTAIEVVILPPWYLTIWFKILTVFFVVTLAYLIYSYRVSVLRRQKKALTALVTERTQKLHQKNEILRKRTIELDKTNQKLEQQKKTIEQQANELKLQAEKLRSGNEDLQKLNNTKDRLFSIIAHDVRSPFNTIIGFPSLLQETAAEGNTGMTIEYARHSHESANQV